MPIGDYNECFYKNPIPRLLCRLFGTQDLHAHYRIRPMIDYFRTIARERGGSEAKVLEIGSGPGQNLFELSKIMRIDAVGYDLNPEHVALARQVSKAKFGDRIPFHISDATAVTESLEYDFILFMDILEHIRNPENIVRQMDRFLKPGGSMVVSVPTPRYPKVFGRKMHERIGHLLDGYTIEALSALFPANYQLTHKRYSTGVLASAACAIQSRLLLRVSNLQLRWLASVPLLALRSCDWINGKNVSSSLFAAYRKTS
ncbi:MAG: class I SAM-dependent methyltransferase [Acidobacteriota bacterium]|nr:class I SAM-dependent methyltransferase [Acidobacteriota bacterium]